MSLRCTLEQSLFTMGNRLAQARADVERWLAEPAASCRALDLSQLEDRVMLSASPAAQAILSEAPVAAVDDALPSGDPAIAAESQSILLSANTPDVPAVADADGTDQTGDESPPEAQSQSIVVDPRDRVVAHYSIGYSASNPETRMVRPDLIERGWEDFVARQIEPALDAGFQRIMLHNPFGIPVDSETGETQIMQFEQYLAAQQELPALAEGFVEAWQPITERGVEVIAYFGGPHNSPTMRALEGDMDAWWDRAWDALQPALDAGMSIGIDNSAPRLASSPTFLLAEALRERGVRVYIEARPHNVNPLWFDYPVVVRDPTWIATDPGLSGRHPIVYSRFPRNEQLSSEILRLIRPNEEEDAQWSRLKQALMDGNSATTYAQNVILPRRGNMNLDELLEFAGVGSVPTHIHLAASGQVGLTYTIVAAPEHGSLTVATGSGSVVTYTPDPGFSGTDSFQFAARLGDQQSEAGTITLTVHSLLAAEDPGDVPDPDQGTLVTPDLDGGPNVPPDTGPGVIPDGDDDPDQGTLVTPDLDGGPIVPPDSGPGVIPAGDAAEALRFGLHDLPDPDQPVTTDWTKDRSQPTKRSAVDLRPLSSGFLAAGRKELLPFGMNEPLPFGTAEPAYYGLATQGGTAEEAATDVSQTEPVSETIAEPGPPADSPPTRRSGEAGVVADALQVVTDPESLGPRPPEIATPRSEVAPAVDQPSRTAKPKAAEPAQEPTEYPTTDLPDDTVDDEGPTVSVVAAALGTAAALSAAAAAHFGGSLPKSGTIDRAEGRLKREHSDA
jgi:hypothetical protein